VLMLFGILTSSLFDNPLSDTRAGGREVFVVDEGVPTTVEGYRVEYTGRTVDAQGRTAHDLAFTDPAGRRFEVHPVTYRSNRDQWIQNPDTKHFVEKDVYVAVSPRAMFEEGGSTAGQVDLARGDSVDVGGAFRLRFERFEMAGSHGADTTGIAVAAVVDVENLSTGERRTLRPVYRMGGQAGHDHAGAVSYVPDGVADWNLTLTLVGMQVDAGAVRLVVEGVEMPAREWLVVQAYEKPLINLLWMGVTVMLFGFGLATYRRVAEQHERAGRADRQAEERAEKRPAKKAAKRPKKA